MNIAAALKHLLSASLPVALIAMGASLVWAQSFAAGAHVEALPYGSDWYPCVVTTGAPNYRVNCTTIDGTTKDFGVPSNRLRADTGQASSEMQKRWAGRFAVGSNVDAAPFGEQNGYHACTVLGVTGNGVRVGIYHLRCSFPGGTRDVDVGATDHIRAATEGTAAQAAKEKAVVDEQNRPPASVKAGTYTCATFLSGRLELRPGLGLTVTGSGSYTGVDGVSGSFTYDGNSGMVTFRGGALSGTTAKYLGLYGGQFKLMNDGRYANVDCNLSQH